MPTKTYLNQAGIWREAKNIWVKQGGIWRVVNEKYVKQGGTWRLVYKRNFEFFDTISSLIFDYNLSTKAVLAGWDGVSPLEATITITASGAVASSSLATPAFLIPTLPTGSVVILNNNGIVAGRGGTGGNGAPSGVCGCLPGQPGTAGGTAILIQSPTTINNLGTIGGGGGGGGGGGAECTYIWNASAGGGGGGAGFGEGGVTNGCGVTFGRFGGPGAAGTLTTGGAGGFPGNPFTASGGAGGNLGMPGNSGQTIDNSGGAGGPPGNAIIGIVNIINWPGIGGTVLGPVS